MPHGFIVLMYSTYSKIIVNNETFQFVLQYLTHSASFLLMIPRWIDTIIYYMTSFLAKNGPVGL